MQKLLLFDLDGTLTDSAIGITNCIRKALVEIGYPEYDRSFLDQFVGPPLLDAFQEVLDMTPEQAQAALEHFTVHFANGGKFDNRVYDGIPELLRNLRAAGYRLEVASSKPEIFVGQILEHFNLLSLFDGYAGAAADESVVKKPDIIRMAMERNGYIGHEENIQMIGDRKYDVEGANVFGIRTIGVLWGYGSREELEHAGATEIVESVDELEQLLVG